MKAIALILVVLTAAGCTSTGQTLSAAAVHGYCGSLTEVERSIARARLDTATAPHLVRIHCYPE